MNQETFKQRAKVPQTIMIVDDEEMVTKTLAAYLELETDFEVLTFQDPVKALEKLHQRRVDLIISDFLMPEMNGLQLIAQAQQLDPDLPCILLTGYADKENAVKAINEVKLFQYVEKPWDNEHISLIIRNALNSKSLRETLERKVRELDKVLLERDKLIQHNEMIKEELKLAKDVQESMLPQKLPESANISIVAKYLPALQIGGDFYDVITLGNNKLGVLIADVTGHGIQAALITILLKSALIDMTVRDLRPGDILTAINNLIYQILPKNIYVAGLAIVIDTETGECQISNGGIPHPILIRKDKRIEKIPVNGLLLGICDESIFKPGEEFRTQLNSGDKLLLFTDGISEAANEKDEQFEEKMFEILARLDCKSGKVMLNDLTQAAKDFSKPDHNWDDITLLSIGDN